MNRTLALLVYAMITWGLCGATMGIGLATTSLERALVIHAIAAPVIAFIVSGHYYRTHTYAAPLQTATAFIAVVIFLDVFLVALVINRSLDMFTNFIGTWLPFLLIFATTYLTGVGWRRRGSTSITRRA